MIRGIARIARLRTVLGREGDSHLRGQAMRVGGVALVADGLIGIDNPLDGRSKRSEVPRVSRTVDELVPRG